MPIMDGFEATRSIRLLERARHAESPAKIIALTGLGSDEHIMKAYAAGVDVFLTKPISFKDILRLLNDQQGQTTENKQ
jgi:FOG: CheY-like receiver